jgi:hypothetical protein
MALDTSAAGLWNEVKRAIEHRDSFLGEPYWESIRRYYGPAYRPHAADVVIDFENHASSWISIFLPILASGNPRVRGKTPRIGEPAAFAKAVELGVNRNFELQEIKTTVEELATDWAFRHCVSVTAPAPVPGMKELEDPPSRPNTVRLSLIDHAWDPLAKSNKRLRFQTHRMIRDGDGLLGEAEAFPERGWRVDDILFARS